MHIAIKQYFINLQSNNHYPFFKKKITYALYQVVLSNKLSGAAVPWPALWEPLFSWAVQFLVITWKKNPPDLLSFSARNMAFLWFPKNDGVLYKLDPFSWIKVSTYYFTSSLQVLPRQFMSGIKLCFIFYFYFLVKNMNFTEDRSLFASW